MGPCPAHDRLPPALALLPCHTSHRCLNLPAAPLTASVPSAPPRLPVTRPMRCQLAVRFSNALPYFARLPSVNPSSRKLDSAPVSEELRSCICTALVAALNRYYAFGSVFVDDAQKGD